MIQAWMTPWLLVAIPCPRRGPQPALVVLASPDENLGRSLTAMASLLA